MTKKSSWFARLFSSKNAAENGGEWKAAAPANPELILARQFFLGAVLLVVLSSGLFFWVFRSAEPAQEKPQIQLTVVNAKTGATIAPSSDVDVDALSEKFTDGVITDASGAVVASQAVAMDIASASGVSKVSDATTPVNKTKTNNKDDKAKALAKLDTKSNSKAKSDVKADAKPDNKDVAKKNEPAQAQWWVQLASFQHESAAKKMIKKLKTQGFRTDLDSVRRDSSIYFRVKVGPFPINKPGNARAMQLRLKKMGYSQAIVFKD